MARISLTAGQTATIAESLRASSLDASRRGEGADVVELRAAADLLRSDQVSRPPHPAWPAVGTRLRYELVVGEDDTAAAMGHTDPAAVVLASPRIALWCELFAARGLPAPSPDLTHVGTGILVHHVGSAGVGDRVELEVTLEAVSGRRGVFGCELTSNGRLVALGTHQRVLIERRPHPVSQSAHDTTELR